MQALEIGDFRLVSGIDQCLKPGFDQCRCAAAEDSLLAEEVRFSLFFERCLQNSGPAAADPFGPGQRKRTSTARSILLHGDQAGNALAFLVDTTHQMAGALGSDHEDIDTRGRLDLPEVDAEAVSEDQRIARLQIGRDALAVDVALDFVIDQNHDDVGFFGRIFHRLDNQTGFFRLAPGLGAGAQPDPNIQPAILQVERVGMALRAVADHGELFAFEQAQIGVVVIVNLRWHGLVFLLGVLSKIRLCQNRVSSAHPSNRVRPAEE